VKCGPRGSTIRYLVVDTENWWAGKKVLDARHGKLTAALSKTAGRYLRATGMPPTVTTHSARHAFTDALRRAKVEPELRSQLLGHSAGTMTARYGSGHDLKALQEAVNAVIYEGLSL
jgi:integrase